MGLYEEMAKIIFQLSSNTLMILSFWTDWSGQIVQTLIRLLLEAQSDQGLHCLQYCLHLLDALLYGKTSFSSFRMITAKFACVRKFRIFTVFTSSVLLRAHLQHMNTATLQPPPAVSMSLKNENW